MAKNIREINTKYAVQLSPLANSFYDPFSKANLFRTTPYYLFNHEPTEALLSGVKHGKLIDLKGNIKAIINGTANQAAEVDVEAIKKQVRAEIESEIRAELEAEYAEKLEKLEAQYAEKAQALASTEEDEAKETKKAGKGKSSDK